MIRQEYKYNFINGLFNKVLAHNKFYSGHKRAYVSNYGALPLAQRAGRRIQKIKVT